MSEITGSNIPDLSQLNGNKPAKPKKVGGFGQVFLVRSADSEGAYEPESINTVFETVTNPDGSKQILEKNNVAFGRSNLVTAEDLVEMIRAVVIQENEILLNSIITRLR